MAIIRYQPSSFMQDMQNEINHLLGRNFTSSDYSAVETSEWLPAVDIWEEEQRFVLVADLPGVDPKSIDINMENGELSIRGSREIEQHDTTSRSERHHGTFYRRFSLPDTANAEQITARCKHGVLEVAIPKTERSVARKIAVEA